MAACRLIAALSFCTTSMQWCTPIFPRTFSLRVLSPSASLIYGFTPSVSVSDIHSDEEVAALGCADWDVRVSRDYGFGGAFSSESLVFIKLEM